MIRLEVLGSIDLRHADGRRLNSVLAQSKRLALLVYLALAAGTRHRRDLLLALLWPDLDEARARHALSQSLHVLRQALGRDVIMNNGDGEVSVDPSLLWCDAVAFEDALRHGDRRRALELYGGELLPGLHVAEVPNFERWLAAERERLRSAATTAALEHAGQALEANVPEEAVRLGTRALEISPFDERALRILMQGLEALGDGTQALRAYRTFESRLRQDLDLAPSPAARGLAERIVAARAAGDAAPSPPVASPRASTEGSAAASPTGKQDPGSAIPSPGGGDGGRSGRGLRARGTIAVLGGFTLIVILLEAVAFRGSGSERSPLERRAPVLVLPFENRSGDPSLDALGFIAADWITAGLMEVRSLPVIASVEALRSSRALASRTAAGDSRAAVLGGELMARTVVGGSYLKRGDEVVFQAQVTDVETATVIVGLADIVAPLADPASGVAMLRERVAAALATLVHEQLAPWTAAATMPPSLEAYRLYAAGLERLYAIDFSNQPQGAGAGALQRERQAFENFRAASRLLRQAATVDSTFTAPLIFAVFADWTSGDGANDIVERLRALRHTLPPWDQAMAEYIVAYRDDRWRDAYLAGRRARMLAQDRERAYNAAWAAVRGGYYQAAVDELRSVQGERLKERPAYWMVLADALHRLGRCDEALAAIRSGQEIQPSDDKLAWSAARQQACVGDTADLRRDIDALLRKNGWPRSVGPVTTVVEELRVHGHAAAARDLALEGLAWYRRTAPGEHDPARPFYLARLVALAGDEAEARALYERALATLERTIDRSVDWHRWAEIDHRGAAGWMAARAGDSLAARAALRWLREREEPRFRPIFPFWTAAIRAELGQREQALRDLSHAVELGYYGRPNLHERVELEALRVDPRFEALIGPVSP